MRIRSTFIIVAVWREENRLILYNHDLPVCSIDADAWKEHELLEVIAAGQVLLNYNFPTLSRLA